MPGRIRWQGTGDNVRSCGRNGGAAQIGLNIYDFDFTEPPVLHLAPVNSKGLETRGCSIEIPMANLQEFIDHLRAIQEGVAQKEPAAQCV